MTFKREYPQLPDTPASHLPFSPCVKAGPLVFVSGQASVDKTGKIIVDTFEGEFRRSMENLIAVLAAAGCTLGDVVQTRNYVDRKEDVAEFNRLCREYFKPPFPARTTITDCFGGSLNAVAEWHSGAELRVIETIAPSEARRIWRRNSGRR